MHDEAGGILIANSACELPQNRRQVYNSYHKLATSSGNADPIFELVQQCKVAIQFIHSVNFESGPCCVLASDIQMQNVIRVCTNPGAQSVFGIDPMFKFYVTRTTFTYSQVVEKTTSVPWTIVVHTEKKYESYLTFSSTYVKLESHIIAISTDGEVAIVQALEANLHRDTDALFT